MGITVCQQSLPGEVSPPGTFKRVIMPLSAVCAPGGLKLTANKAVTAVLYDVTCDIIYVKVRMKLQNWLCPAISSFTSGNCVMTPTYSQPEWEDGSSSLQQPWKGAAGLSTWSQGRGRLLAPFSCTRIMSNELTAADLWDTQGTTLSSSLKPI